ncbi:MAG: hypothetical protein WD066_12995 [Planctomycetaceae bacterium]
MASQRAAEVAEVLWELKRAGKIATFTLIAERAGFSAGTNGRTIVTCLKTVRRDWPHLEWWRAVKDGGIVEGDTEHVAKLREHGFDCEEVDAKKEKLVVKGLEEHLMTWELEEELVE